MLTPRALLCGALQGIASALSAVTRRAALASGRLDTSPRVERDFYLVNNHLIQSEMERLTTFRANSGWRGGLLLERRDKRDSLAGPATRRSGDRDFDVSDSLLINIVRAHLTRPLLNLFLEETTGLDRRASKRAVRCWPDLSTEFVSRGLNAVI